MIGERIGMVDGQIMLMGIDPSAGGYAVRSPAGVQQVFEQPDGTFSTSSTPGGYTGPPVQRTVIPPPPSLGLLPLLMAMTPPRPSPPWGAPQASGETGAPYSLENPPMRWESVNGQIRPSAIQSGPSFGLTK